MRDDLSRVTCPRCGTFDFTNLGWALYPPEGTRGALDKNRYLLSGRARNATLEGRVERFDEKDLGAVERGEIREPDVYEKIRLMLVWFERKSTRAGEWITPVSSTDYPIAYCRDEQEWTHLLLDVAVGEGWLKPDSTGQRFHLTFKGREKLREDAPASATSQPKEPKVFTLPAEFLRYEREIAEFHKVGSFESSVFVMMKFPAPELPAATNKMLKTILDTVRAELSRYGLNARCASDRTYGSSRRLWDNLCVYMLGCKYGLAVLEDRSGKDGKELNPNVTLEYGFMSALGRDVVLMQDQAFTSIRADLLSSIPAPFSIGLGLEVDEQSIRSAIDGWMVDLQLAATRRP